MSDRVLRYSVGNEHSPADPWGRSELVIGADGTAQLEHHFSRKPETGRWRGQVDPAALDALWAALGTAKFPAVPRTSARAPDTAMRRLTVEADGQAAEVLVSWYDTPGLAGYAAAFDLIDGVIRQLSGGEVSYPTRQRQIVGDITRLRPGA